MVAMIRMGFANVFDHVHALCNRFSTLPACLSASLAKELALSARCPST